MEKRGFGHIEFIIAFLLFISAVIFALYFFKPVGNSKIVLSSLSYVNNEIRKNVSVDIITYAVKIKKDKSEVENIAVEVDNPGDMRVRVENYSGVLIPSRKETLNGRNIIKFENNANFVLIKLSEDFDNDLFNGDATLNKENYELASVSMKNVLSEKRILEINKSYYKDYLGTKNELNLGNVDFGFNVIFSDREIRAENNIPKGLEVFGNVEREEVLRSNGKLEFVDIGVKVW